MALPKWLNKYLTIKPIVHQLYQDLEEWNDYCRMTFPAIQFNPADLYKGHNYRAWQEKKRRKQSRIARDQRAQRNNYRR